MDDQKTSNLIVFQDPQELIALMGHQDEHLRFFEEEFAAVLVVRGTEVKIQGNVREVEALSRLLREFQFLYRQGVAVTDHEIKYGLELAKGGELDKLHDLFGDVVVTTIRGKQIKPKTLGQKAYIEAVRRHDITIAAGPAGTGKTFLAVALAVQALKSKQVEKILLTRPAVEAGEKLGFLPGDLQEKVDPYLRPLYDGLYETLGMETVQKYMERQIIEVAPLAYMRGRTLDDAFVILDEAQNTTPAQMKMFLTRLGFGSKMVVNGDMTQVDLPIHHRSGLADSLAILKDIPGVTQIFFTDVDVVRHPVVGRIIRAYERAEK